MLFREKEGSVAKVNNEAQTTGTELALSGSFILSLLSLLYVHGVYSGTFEGGHASVVVEGRVDRVDSNDVDSQGLKMRQISSASVSFSERVHVRVGLRVTSLETMSHRVREGESQINEGESDEERMRERGEKEGR